MIRRRAIVALATAALAFVGTSTHAQYVDVPTFVAGTPTFAPGLQETDVAVGADGNIAIVWGELDFEQWGAGEQIVSRMFSRSGIALGPPTRIDTSGGAGWPLLAARDGGGFVAGWHQTPDGIGGRFYTRWLDAVGRGVTSEIRVDTPNSGPASARSLASLPTGPVYLWRQNGFWIRRYGIDALPLESATSVGGPTPSGFDLHVEALPDGGFIAVWPSWDPPYSWARAYDAGGQPRGPAFTIDVTGAVQSAAVSPNGEIAAVGRVGDFANPSEIWTRRFRADGTLIGSRQVVRTQPPGLSTTANAEFDSRGNLLVVWSEYDSANNVRRTPRMRAYDATRTPLGPDLELGETPSPQEIGIARTHDDCFATSWYNNFVAYMNVVCLCGAGNTACGDGVLDPKCEVCDDGNRVDGDGCDSNCEPGACGNGIVTTAEACDDGNAASGDGCDANCTPTGCGNGVVTQGEQCDDGNDVDGDGCETNCTVTGCGNGVVTAGEECDDGNPRSGDGCDGNCTRTRCGNGLAAAPETCDDGNLVDGDGCDGNCTATGCGNGVLTVGEECEDGNLAHGDGCDGNCLVETCGNERIEGFEQCDDGNRTDGDGCEGDCRFPEIHDSVLFSLKPVEIRLPSGQEPATRNLVLQVQNADVLPDREVPGHVMRLTGSDGDCPPGTLSRMPDFEAGIGGVQDSKQVDGGLPATAHADITVSRAGFKIVDRRVPARCTLWFSVSAVPENLYDPTPDNNVVAVELNVYDDHARLLETEDEVLIQSLSPTLVKIPRGQTSVIEQIKPTVLRAGKKILEDAGMDVVVTAGDGDCPKGTIGIADFDRRAAGTQNRMVLRRGKRARGMLALVVRADAFTSSTDESPRRCTAVLSISGTADMDPSNNTTRLVVDVIDRNDY
jgi:cysteine-rich repeat protein